MEDESVNEKGVNNERETMEDSHSNFPLNEIPYDVMVDVFLFLDRFTLNQMRLVNRQFKNAADTALNHKKYKNGTLCIIQTKLSHEFRYTCEDKQNKSLYGKCYFYGELKNELGENKSNVEIIKCRFTSKCNISIDRVEQNCEDDYVFPKTPFSATLFAHLSTFLRKFEVEELVLRNVHVDGALLRQLYDSLKGKHKMIKISFDNVTAENFTWEQLKCIAQFLRVKKTERFTFTDSPQILRLLFNEDFRKQCPKFASTFSFDYDYKLGKVDYLRIGRAQASLIFDFIGAYTKEILVDKKILLELIEKRYSTWNNRTRIGTWELSTNGEITESDLCNAFYGTGIKYARTYDRVTTYQLSRESSDYVMLVITAKMVPAACYFRAMIINKGNVSGRSFHSISQRRRDPITKILYHDEWEPPARR